jgi:hypothetical protein
MGHAVHPSRNVLHSMIANVTTWRICTTDLNTLLMPLDAMFTEQIERGS